MALTRTQLRKRRSGSMPKNADAGTTKDTHRTYLTFLPQSHESFPREITRIVLSSIAIPDRGSSVSVLTFLHLIAFPCLLMS